MVAESLNFRCALGSITFAHAVPGLIQRHLDANDQDESLGHFLMNEIETLLTISHAKQWPNSWGKLS